MSELVGSGRIAEITGFTRRWVQMHAPEIPGSTKLFGEWRFDEAMVRRWIKASNQRDEKWQPSIKEEKSGGAASSIRASNAAHRLKQRLGLSP